MKIEISGGERALILAAELLKEVVGELRTGRRRGKLTSVEMGWVNGVEHIADKIELNVNRQIKTN